MKALVAIFIVSILTGCSGWNSELDTQYVEPPSLQPKCSFKIADNCWSRSLKLIQSCAPQVASKEVGQLVPNLNHCTFSDRSLVAFTNPSQILNPAWNGDIEFTVYSSEALCYRFTATESSIVIDQNPYGDISVKSMANGDIQVNCLFSESFVIPVKAATHGCSNSKVGVSAFVPSTVISTEAPARTSSISLFMNGMGGEAARVFSCSL